MTTSKKQLQAYNTAMQTMAGTRQVVMLYDGIIRFLLQAREAMQQKRIEARYNNLTRASEIIFGLQSCLDFERGGEVAKVLYNFYTSIDSRIFGLHRSNDAAACDVLIADIRRMRDVWADIDNGTGSQSGIEAAPEGSASGPSSAKPASGTDEASGIAISA